MKLKNIVHKKIRRYERILQISWKCLERKRKKKNIVIRRKYQKNKIEESPRDAQFCIIFK